LSQESNRLQNNTIKSSFHNETIKEGKPQEPSLFDSKIVIRYGKFIIEADASYPSAYLENLVGKLVAVC